MNYYLRRHAAKAKAAPVDFVKHYNRTNSQLTTAELQRIQTTFDDCLAALRRVRYEQVHVQALHTSWQISQEIERSGIVKGFTPQIEAAKAATTAIFNRCQTPAGWRARPLYGPEVSAIDDMAFYYMYQVKQLSYGEMLRMQNRVISRARSTGELVQHVKVESLRVDFEHPAKQADKVTQ